MKIAAAAQVKAKEIGQRVIITVVGPSGDLDLFHEDGRRSVRLDCHLTKAETRAIFRWPTKF